MQMCKECRGDSTAWVAAFSLVTLMSRYLADMFTVLTLCLSFVYDLVQLVGSGYIYKELHTQSIYIILSILYIYDFFKEAFSGWVVVNNELEGT